MKRKISPANLKSFGKGCCTKLHALQKYCCSNKCIKRIVELLRPDRYMMDENHPWCEDPELNRVTLSKKRYWRHQTSFLSKRRFEWRQWRKKIERSFRMPRSRTVAKYSSSHLCYRALPQWYRNVKLDQSFSRSTLKISAEATVLLKQRPLEQAFSQH